MSDETAPTVYVETYGCQMNVSDSELMLGKLSAAGYTPVDVPDGADVILINTCAIRDHAEQRVIGRLGELKRHMKKGSVMGVTGCMAQRLGPLLLEKAKHVSLVVGPDGYRALPQLVEGARHGRRSINTTFDLEEHYEDFTPRRFDKVKAWIPVQRGCDYRCTYCIVPTTRGAERSRKRTCRENPAGDRKDDRRDWCTTPETRDSHPALHGRTDVRQRSAPSMRQPCARRYGGESPRALNVERPVVGRDEVLACSLIQATVELRRACRPRHGRPVARKSRRIGDRGECEPRAGPRRRHR